MKIGRMFNLQLKLRKVKMGLSSLNFKSDFNWQIYYFVDFHRIGTITEYNLFFVGLVKISLEYVNHKLLFFSIHKTRNPKSHISNVANSCKAIYSTVM